MLKKIGHSMKHVTARKDLRLARNYIFYLEFS